MLSSRYLHLHEALGLGPMWLAQGAAVRPSEKAAAPVAALAPAAAAVAALARHNPPMAERTLSPSAHQARQAAVSAVKQPAPALPKTAPAVSVPESPTAAPVPTEPHALPRLHIAVQPARLMVLAPCPAPEDLLHGALFSGSSGVLLDNMLAAIGLNPQAVHKTAWLKSAPAFAEPDAAAMMQELAAMQAELAAMQAELAGCGAEAVLLLGQAFNRPEHAAAAAQLCGGLPCFTVPHPARLLRQPQLKAQAWQELKRLRAALAQTH